MAANLLQQAYAALAQFSSASRLYELTIDSEGELGSGGLLVEAFLSDDGLQACATRDVIALSTSAHVDIAALPGARATLQASLADGSRTGFHGFISQAALLGSEGGLARYRLRITPWLWLLTQSRNSRVWQDRSVAEIADAVFQDYAPLAAWRWSDDALAALSAIPPRSYCCQYRESDFDFVLRLLSEEGIGWRFEDGEREQMLVLFAESSQQSATPEDASSAAGQGIRFHAARAGEAQDSVLALQVRRRLQTGTVSLASYDYKAKQALLASASGTGASQLESYDYPGQYYFASKAEGQRYARLQMQALEAQAATWQGHSTVRTLRAGTRFTLTQGPLGTQAGGQELLVLRVISVGLNNLPAPAAHALAELFGPVPELLEDISTTLPDLPRDFAQTLEQAAASGYANSLQALDAAQPWRPMPGVHGARQHARPTASGCQSAIVVGADADGGGAGSDEIHCDRLGRVRIRFHWQDQAQAACWVRVAQRSAGGGMGSQFLPRIGQEVLVQFLENDIDRPVIIGALYNGQGEGGVPPTPGGMAADGAEAAFDRAGDSSVSSQGNLAGGNAPVWHGASGESGGHRNGASMWGVRSKEFGSSGYNQLLFDDTDNQGRVQLRSTLAATELNLGHLVHQADNYRGSLRGQGAELRTDAYGAVRGGAGLLVSSYALKHSPQQREPAGDNTAGIAMLKQAQTLAKTFSDAALKHQTVELAASIGVRSGKASALDEGEAPLQALLTAVSGMVSSKALEEAQADAGKRCAAADAGKLPHSADPLAVIAAREGLSMSAAKDVQIAASELAMAMAGQDAQLATGGQLRLHTGQALGLLGGAVAPGEQELGVQLIAAKEFIDVQAQADAMTVQARDAVNVKSVNAHIDWAAAKKISISTAGGANITIDGGNITVQCPGKITIHAGKKSFEGPAREEYVMPVMPGGEVSWVQLASTYDDAWNTPWPLDQLKFSLDGKAVAKGQSVNPLK